MKITEERAEELAGILREELEDVTFDKVTNLLTSEHPYLKGDDFWDAVAEITRKI